MECLLAFPIGYAFGCFLAADVVCRMSVHKSCFSIGDGNPGMANVGHVLGTKAALAVLAGEILKTLLAVLISWALLGHTLAVTLWAGFGATAGHNFPIWHHFQGGKGVTTTCSTIILASPLAGILSSIAGFAVGVVALGYLCLGALLIPSIFFVWIAIAGAGAWALVPAALLVLLMFKAHLPAALHIKDGSTPHASIADKTLELLHLKKS